MNDDESIIQKIEDCGCSETEKDQLTNFMLVIKSVVMATGIKDSKLLVNCLANALGMVIIDTVDEEYHEKVIQAIGDLIRMFVKSNKDKSE